MIVITSGLLLNYTCYVGLYSLQSSLLREEGLGTTSQSLDNMSYGLSALLLSPLIIGKLGHKWTFVIGICGIASWIVANGIGTWHVMIPTSVIEGACAALVWVSSQSYIIQLAKIYEKQDGGKRSFDQIGSVFYGVFSIAMPISGLISSAVNSFLLLHVSKNTESSNSSLDVCGVNYCPWNDTHIDSGNFNDPSSLMVWILVGVYAVIVVLNILLSIFMLDDIPKLGVPVDDDKSIEDRSKEKLVTLLLACFRLMKNYKIWLLFVITSYDSLNYSFHYSTFTSGWVSCTSGTSMVGLVTLPGYVAGIVVSILSGLVIKAYSRIPSITAGLCVTVIYVVLLQFISVNEEGMTWLLFVLSTLYSVGGRILMPVSSILYGMVTDDTSSSFAFLSFSWALTSAVVLAYDYYLCGGVKLVILAVSASVAFVCYYAMEWILKKQRKSIVTEVASSKNVGDETLL